MKGTDSFFRSGVVKFDLETPTTALLDRSDVERGAA